MREAKGVTGTAVEAHFGWSPGKISRMERGDWVFPNLRDVRDLLDLYGITDEVTRERMLALARDGRQRGWWHTYRDMMSDSATTYIGLEAEAASVNMYQIASIPGLLQIPDYMRPMIRTGPAQISDEEVEKRVEIRLTRQQSLVGEDALRLFAVLDEAVLHRVVGSPEVMRAQLRHLIKMADLPNVNIQVAPFSAGNSVGLTNFCILQFQEPDDRDAVYVEMYTSELFIEEPEEVRFYSNFFQYMNASALSPAETLAKLRELAS